MRYRKASRSAKSLRTLALPMLVLVSLAGGQSPAQAATLLVNGDFKLAAVQGGGQSAAKNWTVATNTQGSTIKTELLPSTLVNGGRMIHVDTTGERNGLVQVFGTLDKGPRKVYACAWIYIVKGQVVIGTGNGGSTGSDVVLWKTGSWERLEVSNGVSPANEFIIYAASWGGAEFYVESAEIHASHGPVGCTPK